MALTNRRALHRSSTRNSHLVVGRARRSVSWPLVACGLSVAAVVGSVLPPASASAKGSASGSFTFTGALKGKLNVSSAQCSTNAPQAGSNGKVEITWYTGTLGGPKGAKEAPYILDINAPTGPTTLSKSAEASKNIDVTLNDPKNRLWQSTSGTLTSGQGMRSGHVSAATLAVGGSTTKMSGSWKCS